MILGQSKNRTIFAASSLLALSAALGYWLSARDKSESGDVASIMAEVARSPVTVPSMEKVGDANTSATSKMTAQSVGSNNVLSHGPPAINDSQGYAALDTQLQDEIAIPAWFYTDRDLYTEVARMDINATVGEVKCGHTVCRVIVQHQSAVDRETFATRGRQARAALLEKIHANTKPLGATSFDASTSESKQEITTQKVPPVGSTTIYNFPKHDPSQTIVYVLKMDSKAEIIDRVASSRQSAP